MVIMTSPTSRIRYARTITPHCHQTITSHHYLIAANHHHHCWHYHHDHCRQHFIISISVVIIIAITITIKIVVTDHDYHYVHHQHHNHHRHHHHHHHVHHHRHDHDHDHHHHHHCHHHRHHHHHHITITTIVVIITTPTITMCPQKPQIEHFGAAVCMRALSNITLMLSKPQWAPLDCRVVSVSGRRVEMYNSSGWTSAWFHSVWEISKHQGVGRWLHAKSILPYYLNKIIISFYLGDSV